MSFVEPQAKQGPPPIPSLSLGRLRHALRCLGHGHGGPCVHLRAEERGDEFLSFALQAKHISPVGPKGKLSLLDTRCIFARGFSCQNEANANKAPEVTSGSWFV